MEIANGLNEYLQEVADELHFLLRRAVAPPIIGDPARTDIFFITVYGTDIIKLVLAGQRLTLWRMLPGELSPSIRKFIKEYTGRFYQGGGLHFDLGHPDSLHKLADSIKILLKDYQEYLIEKASRAVAELGDD